MAKRKNRNLSLSKKAGTRVVKYNANLRLRRRKKIKSIAVADRRLYTPFRSLAYALKANGNVASIASVPRKSPPTNLPNASHWAGLSFVDPKKVKICSRRKERREVLMAKGVGGTRVRRGKRNYYSDVKC